MGAKYIYCAAVTFQHKSSSKFGIYIWVLTMQLFDICLRLSKVQWSELLECTVLLDCWQHLTIFIVIWSFESFSQKSSYWYCELMFFLSFQPETMLKIPSNVHVLALIISFGIHNFSYGFCQASFCQPLVICPRLS